MSLFRDIGRRVESLKQQVGDAATEQARFECRDCGELFFAARDACPECGSENVVAHDGHGSDT